MNHIQTSCNIDHSVVTVSTTVSLCTSHPWNSQRPLCNRWQQIQVRRQLKVLAMHWGGWPSHKRVPASVSYTALIHMYIIWGCYTSYRNRTEGRVLLCYAPHIILFVTWRICVTVQLHHCSKYTVQSYPLASSHLSTLVLIIWFMLYVAVCVTEVTLLTHHTQSQRDAFNDLYAQAQLLYIYAVCMISDIHCMHT